MNGEGKMRNEFAEWHVAWLAQWHNYAEFNIRRSFPQATFFCDQHDFLVATDALFSKGDKRISCCGNLISTLISG